MKKMRVLALALAAFVCMSAFAGCSNNQTQGSSNSSQSSGESSADASSDVLKIGFLGPLTGDAAQYGQAVQDGANLYIEEVNANGGVMGKQVELVSYDTKGDEVESLSAFNRLVSQDKVDAILGEVTSAPTLAVAQESAKMDDPIPMITASATADEVTSYGDNMFRSCFLDPFQGETMARYAKEVLNAKTAAIIFDNGLDYGVGLKESFEAKCKELGVEVVATESYSTGDVDFKAQLTNIQQKNPDVLFCPDYYGVVTMIVQQATELGFDDITYLGCDGWDGVLKVASDSSIFKSVYFSNHYSSDDTEEVVQNFLEKYKDKYGEDPSSFAATAYDAMRILCNAFEEAGSTEHQAVIAKMKETSLDCVTGHITFDEKNNPIKTCAIITIEDGKYKLDQKY